VSTRCNLKYRLASRPSMGSSCSPHQARRYTRSQGQRRGVHGRRSNLRADRLAHATGEDIFTAFTESSDLDLWDMPYTHSLVGTVAWAASPPRWRRTSSPISSCMCAICIKRVRRRLRSLPYRLRRRTGSLRFTCPVRAGRPRRAPAARWVSGGARGWRGWRRRRGEWRGCASRRRRRRRPERRWRTRA
jgi:hypothetical protein